MAELAETITERRRLTRNRIYRFLAQAQQPRTKQEISQTLALSLPTVHQNLQELLEAGLVEHGGQQQSTGGRRATGMTLAANARFAVGVSVTQTRFRFLAANLRCEEIAYWKTDAFPSQDAAGLGRLLAQELEEFLTRFGLNRSKLLGVGIAVPGILDAGGSKIMFAPTMRLRGIETHVLTGQIPYPCFVCNDASAGGYAEWLAQEEKASIAYLSLENGVGGAVLLAGAPYDGLNGRSGEFGHLCVEPGGLPCKCGKRGCLEAYCSAARISDDLGITLEDFFDGLAAYNPTNESLWEDFLGHLAIGLNDIRMVLDCNIILGGYLTQYMGPYLPHLRELTAALNSFGPDADYIQLCRYPKRDIPLGVALHFISSFMETL